MTQRRHVSDDGSPGIDAHLRKALDHAPDARLEPPAAVDEAILHAARREAHTSRHRAPSTPDAASQGLRARLRAWWQRPTAVPALAVLVLATVVVSMWSRQPIPSAMDKPAPETSTGNLETGAAATAAVAETAPSSPAAAAAPGLDAAASPPTAPAPPALPSTTALKRARDGVVAPKAKAQVEGRPAAAAEALAPSEAKASLREGMAEAITQARREQAASPAPLPAIPPAAPATPATPAATAAPAARAAPALASNAQGAGVAPSPADATRRMSAVEATTPSDRLLQIVAKSSRWSWRQDRSQQNTAIDADTSQWLTRLARITAGRWVRLTAKADAGSAAASTELWQLHELHATITLGDKSVDWIDRDGNTWRAALSPDEVSRLRR